MARSDLPDEAETWAQFQRICAHPLFARSSNHQALLRFLIQRRYTESTDFSGKTIAFELFGRDTTIAKVEGRTVRNKLSEYYSGDGSNAPIIIRLPPKTFEPEISSATRLLELSDAEAIALYNARGLTNVPESWTLTMALNSIMTVLQTNPRHPLLLSIKALIHVLRTLYGAVPGVEFEAAEYLVKDVEAMHYQNSEIIVAKACIYASRCQWKLAESCFEDALVIREPGRYVVPRCPWYLLFLAAHQRFGEVLEILEFISNSNHNHLIQAERVMMYILLDEIEEARKAIDEGLSFVEWESWQQELLKPLLAVVYGEEGDFASAVKVITEVIDLPANAIIGPALPGLRVLFTGLGGNVKQARDKYDEMKEDRGMYDFKEESLRLPRGHCSAFNLALGALGSGMSDQAVEWLRIALIQERDPLALWMHILPFLRPLHGHRGFRSLVTKTLHMRI